LKIVNEFKEKVGFVPKEIKEKKLKKIKKEKPLVVAKADADAATKTQITKSNKKIQLDNEKIVKENAASTKFNEEAKVYNAENAAGNAINKAANDKEKLKAMEKGKEYYTQERTKLKELKAARRAVKKAKGKGSKSWKDADAAFQAQKAVWKSVKDLINKSG